MAASNRVRVVMYTIGGFAALKSCRLISVGGMVVTDPLLLKVTIYKI